MSLPTDGVRMKIISVGQSCCRVEVQGSQGMAQFNEEWCKQFNVGMDLLITGFELSWRDGVFSLRPIVSLPRCSLFLRHVGDVSTPVSSLLDLEVGRMQPPRWELNRFC